MFGKKLKDHTPAYSQNKINEMNNFIYLNENICRENQIVFAGDSITEFCRISDWYGDYMSETGLCIYNRGIGGDTSDHLLERWEKTVLNIKPCCIVLLIGTNDQGVMAPETTVSYIEKIVATTKKELPEVKFILQGVYPVNTVEFRGNEKRRNRDNIERINGGLKRLTKKYDIDYLDLTDILSDEKGNLKASYSDDGLHLNARGYEKTSRIIADKLPR